MHARPFALTVDSPTLAVFASLTLELSFSIAGRVQEMILESMHGNTSAINVVKVEDIDESPIAITSDVRAQQRHLIIM